MLLLKYILHLVLLLPRLHLVLHAHLVLLPLVLLLILLPPLHLHLRLLLLEVQVRRVTRRAYHGQHIVCHETATPASAFTVGLAPSVLVPGLSVQPTAFYPLR